MASHPPANNIIIAHIGGVEYKAYVTHIEYLYEDFLGRVKAPWQMKFSYFISKHREKGLIAGWEKSPDDPFSIEILPANPNKYQQHATYKGIAKFNEVVEYKELVPVRADFLLDIIGARAV